MKAADDRRDWLPGAKCPGTQSAFDSPLQRLRQSCPLSQFEHRRGYLPDRNSRVPSYDHLVSARRAFDAVRDFQGFGLSEQAHPMMADALIGASGLDTVLHIRRDPLHQPHRRRIEPAKRPCRAGLFDTIHVNQQTTYMLFLLLALSVRYRPTPFTPPPRIGAEFRRPDSA